jgi:hypothetical protein
MLGQRGQSRLPGSVIGQPSQLAKQKVILIEAHLNAGHSSLREPLEDSRRPLFPCLWTQLVQGECGLARSGIPGCILVIVGRVEQLHE